MGRKYQLKSGALIITPTNEQDLWNCDWNIQVKDKLAITDIGVVTFAGEKAMGTVPIFVELQERYRNLGYGTEVLKMMVNWAFCHKNVYEVTCVAEHENDKGIYSLQKAGFVYRGQEHKVETYSIVKPRTTWTGVYVLIGILVGLIVGIVFNSIWIGFFIGLSVSFLIGAMMDSKASAQREQVTGKKNDRKHKKS